MRKKVLSRNWIILILFQIYFFTYNFFIDNKSNYCLFFTHVFFSLFLYFVVSKIFKKYNSNSLFLSYIITFIIPFEFFEIIKTPVKSIYNISNSIVFSIIFIVLTILILYYLIKNFANKLKSIILVSLLLLISLSIYEIFNERPKKINLKSNNKNNIIFIIFDEHTSPEILKNEFLYDYNLKLDSPFLFKIIPNSKSFYRSTFLSLNHLFSLGKNAPKVNIKNIGKSINEIQENNFLESFKNLDYDVNFYSMLNQKDSLLYDKNINSYIENTAISSSLYMYLYNSLAYKPQFQNIFTKETNYNEDTVRIHQFQILNQKLLNRFNSKSKNQFIDVYHYLIPHAPYNIVYDSVNTCLLQNNNSKFSITKALYLENIKQTQIYIQNILNQFSKSKIKENTILIIQGDHGYRGYDINEKNMYGVLNILYLPKINKNLNFEKTSNTNTLIRILNNYFNQNIEEIN